MKDNSAKVKVVDFAHGQAELDRATHNRAEIDYATHGCAEPVLAALFGVGL